MDQPQSHVWAEQVVHIPQSDRWQAHQRLQELGIPCHCLNDGRFTAAIAHPIAAIQLWSVIQQLTAPRHQLSSWLERCWQLKG